MTLIPLISAIVATPEAATVPAGAHQALQPRNSYGAGQSHRPVAALLAVGLPAVLVVAVALSPMVVEPGPRSVPLIGTIIDLPTPPPPPPEVVEDAKPTPKTSSASDTVEPIVKTIPLGDDRVEPGPVIVDLPRIDPGPPVPPVDPPAPPKLVLADVDPRFAGAFQPDYPAREQRGGIEGVAKVRVLIGADGRVKAVELISADSPGFFEATKRRALAKWRFKPATRGGVPEESWKVMTVRFEIKNA